MTYHVISDPVEVREVLRRDRDFVPTNALTSVVPLQPATLRVLACGGFALPPVLASATGAGHRQVRDIVAGFFSPQRVAALSPRLVELSRQHAGDIAGQLAGGAVADLVALAQRVPAVVMSELIGLPCLDLTLLNRWSQDSLELFWGWPDEQRQLRLADSAVQFYGWLREQVLHAQGGRLFAELRNAKLDLPAICSLGYFLVIAAQQTTSQLIATAFYRGLQRPQSWPELGSAAAARAHIRQVLATESSVHTWRRRAGHDTELAGRQLPAGSEILLELTGNHGSDAHRTAYTLAFGHGLHRCLGARLAELEAVTVLRETSLLLPDLQLVGAEPEWLRLLSFQAPLAVTVVRAGS